MTETFKARRVEFNPAQTRNSSGDLSVHNTHTETFPDGIMLRFEVTVGRELMGIRSPEGPILVDEYNIWVKQEHFHYGQQILKKEGTYTLYYTPWVGAPSPITLPISIGGQVVCLYLLGDGEEFDGPVEPDEESRQKMAKGFISSDLIDADTVDDMYEKAKKEGQLVRKRLPKMFVVGIGDTAELLKELSAQ